MTLIKRMTSQMHVVFLSLPFVFTAGCVSADVCNKNENIKECASRLMSSDRFDEAYAALAPLATRGDSEAQLAVAMLVAGGHGDDAAKGSDDKTRKLLAFPWIEKAANGGETQAILWLADGYKFGWFGLPVNLKIEECLREVAKKKRSTSVQNCRQN